jgi:Rhodopirellula transposase DDE domain
MMPDAGVVQWIRAKFEPLRNELDERARRRWAAVESLSLGWGGIAAVSAATGLSPKTIRLGRRELEAKQGTDKPRRIRRAGGGRKKLTAQDAQLLPALEALVEPATRGDPESPLRWTCKSTRQLAAELNRRQHRVSHTKVAQLLRAAGYSLQANRKTREGAAHPDRNAQFEHINEQTKACQKRGQPVISVDTKKKELVGDFRNGGREWRPRGKPLEVRVHDFQDPALGKAIPYGVYDVTNNEAWVSVGLDHDTAEFAAEAIRRWWTKMGRRRFPKARQLYVTADGGGSNGSRSRLWKAALQQLADKTGLTLLVSHFPPGTSKWNKIEHRLFCHITQNWRGKPLVSHEIIVQLIGATTTATGLKVKAALDRRQYPTRQKITDEQLQQVRLKPADFHGDWNYSIRPHRKIR